MAHVICDLSTSHDGHVTGPNDSRENPFGDGAGMLHDSMLDAATGEDRAILPEMLDGVGATVMGRIAPSDGYRAAQLLWSGRTAAIWPWSARPSGSSVEETARAWTEGI